MGWKPPVKAGPREAVLPKGGPIGLKKGGAAKYPNKKFKKLASMPLSGANLGSKLMKKAAV